MANPSRKDSQKKTTGQEQTLKRSPGTRVDYSRVRVCSLHGEYESRGVQILDGPVIWEACPLCREQYEQGIRENERRAKARRRKRMREVSGVPKRFEGKTLDGFRAMTKKQEKVIQSAKNYLKTVLSGGHPPLIMCGRPGTGKTHIGCAIVQAVIDRDMAAIIVSTANLMRQVKETYRKDGGDEERVYAFYGSIPLLVIDEIGVQFGSETEKLIFYEVINLRYNNLLPTILISNLTSEELCGFIGERAFDRFREDGGAVLTFDWESWRGGNA